MVSKFHTSASAMLNNGGGYKRSHSFLSRSFKNIRNNLKVDEPTFMYHSNHN